MKTSCVRLVFCLIGCACLGCNDSYSSKERDELFQQRAALQAIIDQNTIPVNQLTAEQRTYYGQIDRRITEIDSRIYEIDHPSVVD